MTVNQFSLPERSIAAQKKHIHCPLRSGWSAVPNTARIKGANKVMISSAGKGMISSAIHILLGVQQYLVEVTSGINSKGNYLWTMTLMIGAARDCKYRDTSRDINQVRKVRIDHCPVLVNRMRTTDR
jgi:hypothetical protein